MSKAREMSDRCKATRLDEPSVPRGTWITYENATGEHTRYVVGECAAYGLHLSRDRGDPFIHYSVERARAELFPKVDRLKVAE